MERKYIINKRNPEISDIAYDLYVRGITVKNPIIQKEMTKDEIIRYLENKIKQNNIIMNKFKTYLGEELFDSILELEKYLDNNSEIIKDGDVCYGT